MQNVCRIEISPGRDTCEDPPFDRAAGDFVSVMRIKEMYSNSKEAEE